MSWDSASSFRASPRQSIALVESFRYVSSTLGLRLLVAVRANVCVDGAATRQHRGLALAVVDIYAATPLTSVRYVPTTLKQGQYRKTFQHKCCMDSRVFTLGTSECIFSLLPCTQQQYRDLRDPHPHEHAHGQHSATPLARLRYVPTSCRDVGGWGRPDSQSGTGLRGRRRGREVGADGNEHAALLLARVRYVASRRGDGMRSLAFETSRLRLLDEGPHASIRREVWWQKEERGWRCDTDDVRDRRLVGSPALDPYHQGMRRLVRAGHSMDAWRALEQKQTATALNGEYGIIKYQYKFVLTVVSVQTR